MLPPVDKSRLLQSFLEAGDFCKYIATYQSHDVSYLKGLGLNQASLEFLVDALDMIAYSIEQRIVEDRKEQERLERASMPGKIINIKDYIKEVKL